MRTGYFKAAWTDIKSSPGWFSKLLLLGLISLIPIFGQIVVLGYLYGWARDIAWDVKSPMPAHIFGNEDGRLYSRGFFVLVVGFVFSLVPGVIEAIGSCLGMAPFALFGASRTGWMIGLSAGVLGVLVFAATIAATFFAYLFTWVGSMRMAVYGRLSAGFQIGKLWSMMRYDFGGLLRIFGMTLLIDLVAGAAIFAVVMVMVLVGGFAGVAAIGSPGMNARYGASEVGAILAFIGVALVLMLVLVYVTLVVSAFSSAMTARAMGYWTRQFDVPHWQGQDDPLPFEVDPPQGQDVSQQPLWAQMQYPQAQAQGQQGQPSQGQVEPRVQQQAGVQDQPQVPQPQVVQAQAQAQPQPQVQNDQQLQPQERADGQLQGQAGAGSSDDLRESSRGSAQD